MTLLVKMALYASCECARPSWSDAHGRGLWFNIGEQPGSVGDARVNGQVAGHLVCRAWEVVVTDHIAAGRNTVQAQVMGTLKNTLGAHHGKPVTGKA